MSVDAKMKTNTPIHCYPGDETLRALTTILFFWLSLWASLTPVSAQPLISPSPYARLMEVLDGVNIGEVNRIKQSKDGLIWLATNDGLIRFDGYNAWRFIHLSGEPGSLSHNKVMDVNEDAQGNLWINTYGGGLNKFNPQTEQFEKVTFSQDFQDQNNNEFLFRSVIDNEQSLWLGTQKGIRRLDIKSGEIKAPPFDTRAVQSRSIIDIFIDSRQHTWLVSKFNGVYRYDGNTLRHFNHTAGLPDDEIFDIGEDSEGTIWLGTKVGLYRFNRTTAFFEPKTPSYESSFQIPDSEIRALAADHRQQLWLGTQNSGMHLYQFADDRFSPLTGDGRLQENYKVEKVNDIFVDNQGSIWVATDDGILYVPRTALDISYLANEEGNFEVTDIKQLQSGKIAFVGNYQYYDYEPGKNTAYGRFADENRLYRITETQQGDLLFATIGQGLQRYNKADDNLIQLAHAKPLDSNIPITGLFDSFVDSAQRTWLLPFPDLPHLAGGIIRFDWQSKQYQTYLTTPFISDVVQWDEEHLLLSSDSAGLLSLNIETKQVTPWQQKIPSAPKRVLSLFKDSEQNLWAGTRGQGLAKFDADDNAFSYFDASDGLLSQDIFSIIEDKAQNLWLGTDKGLIRFNRQTGELMTLQQTDGLLFETFYKRAAALADDGRLLFGTTGALVSLDPKDFSERVDSPNIVISDFKLFNRSVQWHHNDDSALLKSPVKYAESLQLNYKHSMFSFEFSANEYIKPEAIRFAYKMDGLSDWVYTDSKNRVASYTTLPTGEYTFRVKATNRHGQWGEQEAALNISVLPPWWLSWPAYILYAIVLTLSILLFINIRTKKLVQRAQELEENVAERTAQLQHSRDQVTELLAQKQQLFASVSHEFRTPLTLILSPIDQLLKDPKGQAITKELGLIKRNGRRLLRMVDQLLEFAKLELKDDSQMEPVSLKQTLDIIVSSFEPLVKTKQIKLHIGDYEDATLNMLPDSLNKILINILSNAFKYSPPQSHIYVTVQRQSQHVAIAIRDTGIGISQTDIDAVFQRFNRATQSHGEAVPGAGIGLALVKELVEANFGTIVLDSELNVGSTFTVTLPVTEVGVFSSSFSETSTHQVLHDQLDLEIDSVNTADISPAQSKVVELNEQQKSVLIVDDNPDLRDLLYQQLNGKYQCLLAENGQEGLNLAKEHLPDLVISDVMMPVMDGYQLTSQLKNEELTSHIPVILLTAKGSTESRLKGLQLLVDDYLAKPFNMEELLLRIHNILTIRDIIKQKFKQAIDHVDPKPAMEKLSVRDPEQAFVNRVNEHLSKLYTDPEFTAKVLSRELGVSERQLQRKLKSQFDLGFPELVRNYRLNKAVEMLSSGQRVSQIYHLVGFSSHSYFSSCFKAKFGQTPKEYQQETA